MTSNTAPFERVGLCYILLKECGVAVQGVPAGVIPVVRVICHPLPGLLIVLNREKIETGPDLCKEALFPLTGATICAVDPLFDIADGHEVIF